MAKKDEAYQDDELSDFDEEWEEDDPEYVDDVPIVRPRENRRITTVSRVKMTFTMEDGPTRMETAFGPDLWIITYSREGFMDLMGDLYDRMCRVARGGEQESDSSVTDDTGDHERRQHVSPNLARASISRIRVPNRADNRHVPEQKDYSPAQESGCASGGRLAERSSPGTLITFHTVVHLHVDGRCPLVILVMRGLRQTHPVIPQVFCFRAG